MNWLEALKTLQEYRMVKDDRGNHYRMVSRNGEDVLEFKWLSRGFHNWSEYPGMLNEFIGKRFTLI
jgi:hypothetical protein